jgi:hypothetical protein
VIVSGEFGASLTSEIDPVTPPPFAGAKTALNDLLPPALIVIGSEGRPVMLKPEPSTFACEIVTAAEPPLVRLIVCELLFPVVTVPKFALEGLALSAPCVPTPMSAIFNGEPGASFVIEMLPVAEPVPLGANFAVNDVLWPADSVVAARPLML